MLNASFKSFRDVWDFVKAGAWKTGTFEVDRKSKTVSAIRHHMEALGAHGKCYGVYAIWQGEHLLCVGKAGTVHQGGRYRAQDLLGRLLNTRKGGSAETTYSQWLAERPEPLRFDFAVLACTSSPQWQPGSLSPALAEGLLLQAHLNEQGRLPLYNTTL